MKKYGLIFILFFTILFTDVFAQEKLRRKDCFFGWHFDFHASYVDKELGKNFDTDTLDEFIKRTKPDFIQIDSKGHPGYSSYPTKIGYSANSFINDPIKLWKGVAEKYNVATFVHYSGLLDTEALKRHPEWSRISQNGLPDKDRVGFFSKYSDELLIPQLKEMIDNYDIDGAWIDGDCWAALVDYSTENVNKFLAATNLKEAPKETAHKDFALWKEFNRESFKQYVRHYVDAIHNYAPNFQITSNWAFSSQMPEPVSINLDFLSGDVSPDRSVYSAAFQARCMALQGKSWDLMSWGLIPVNIALNEGKAIYTPKPIEQLKQEAAEVIAMGGGFQVYFRQNRDGSFQQSHSLEALEELAKFCRERQAFSHKNTIIPQVGIWYSSKGWKEKNNSEWKIYGSSFVPNLKGIFNLLLEGGNSVEILMDHHLIKKLDEYPVIVVPEWETLDTAMNDRLVNYVKNGGNLLIIGAKAVQNYKNFSGVEFENDIVSKVDLIIGDKKSESMVAFKTNWQPVVPKLNTEIIGEIYNQVDFKYSTNYPVATINRLGNGKIGAVYMDFSPAYDQYSNPFYHNILNKLLHRLSADLIKIEGTQGVHTVLSRKNGRTFVHLINSNGPHDNKNVFGYTHLCPTSKFTVCLKTEKPREVRLQPENKKLKFKIKDDIVQIEVPSVKYHSIIEVVPKEQH